MPIWPEEELTLVVTAKPGSHSHSLTHTQHQTKIELYVDDLLAFQSSRNTKDFGDKSVDVRAFGLSEIVGFPEMALYAVVVRPCLGLSS